MGFDSWFARWFNHLPGKPIDFPPKRTPMAGSVFRARPEERLRLDLRKSQEAQRAAEAESRRLQDQNAARFAFCSVESKVGRGRVPF